MSTRLEDLELELRDVVLALKDVAGTQWYDLGLQLHLSPSTLDTIAAHHNADDHKRMMLRKWLQSDPEASWEKLAAALTLTGHETTAANVRSRFVKFTVQVATETDQGEIGHALTESNLQKIKAKFSSLSREVQSALQSSQVNVNEVYSFLVRCFSRDDWTQNPLSFDQLFNALSVAKLWNYDHYHPLEEVTKEFLSSNAAIKKLVSEYKSHLTGFYTTTKIADFIKVHRSEFEDTEQDPQELLPVNAYTLKDYRRLKVTLNLGQRKVSALTLLYVDELWRSLAEEFDLPSLTAIIDTIVKGSLQVSWLVLPHIAEKIMSVSTKAVKFFHLHSITRVEVDNLTVYDEEEIIDYEGQLFEICEGKGDTDAISELVLQHGVDVNLINKDGETPLCVAAECGNVNVVEALIQCGASVNQQSEDEWGYTPLMYACCEGYVDVAKVLVERDATVDLLSKNGQSALFVASGYGETAVVGFLLEHGASINLPTHDHVAGNSSLHISSRRGYNEVVKVLLEYGVQVDLPDKDGDTALIQACKGGHLETVRVLLLHGASVDYQNKEGNSSLHISSERGDVTVVKALLEYEAQVNIANEDGWRPLALACHNGHSNVAKVLLQHGANVNQQNDDEWGITPLIGACWEGHIKTAQLLVENGAIVDLKNKVGQSPLYVAAHYGEAAAVRFLLERGADVNLSTQDEFAFTALMATCNYGNAEIVKIILEHRTANIDYQNYKNGWTALMYAVNKGNSDIVKMLIDHGAATELRSKTGVTALGLAKTQQIRKQLLEQFIKEKAQEEFDSQQQDTENQERGMESHESERETAAEFQTSNNTELTELTTEEEAKLESDNQEDTENQELKRKVESHKKERKTAAESQVTEELTEEQKQEVKSVRQRAQELLERVFFKEQVKKKEHQKKQHEESHSNRDNSQPITPESDKVRVLFGRIIWRRRRQQRIMGASPEAAEYNVM